MILFIRDFACLQAINLTNSKTGDLVFMGRTKFYPVYAESSWWNTLMLICGLTKFDFIIISYTFVGNSGWSISAQLLSLKK